MGKPTTTTTKKQQKENAIQQLQYFRHHGLLKPTQLRRPRLFRISPTSSTNPAIQKSPKTKNRETTTRITFRLSFCAASTRHSKTSSQNPLQRPILFRQLRISL